MDGISTIVPNDGTASGDGIAKPLAEAPEAGGPGAAQALAATGLLALAACGDGGGSGGGSTPVPVPTPVPTVAPITAKQASRFLSQAGIGYSRAEMSDVTSQGFNGWLNSQFGMPRPQRFWDFLMANGYNAVRTF